MRFLALLLLSFSAIAATPPGPAGGRPPEYPYCTDGKVLFDIPNDAHAYVWYCDANFDGVIDHLWHRYGWGGKISADAATMTSDTYKAILSNFGFQTKAQLQAAYDKAFPVGSHTICDANGPEYWGPACDLYTHAPAPDFAPPSGYMTQNVNVWKMRDGINTAPTFVIIGRVPLGTSCLLNNVYEMKFPYFQIDRTKITLNNKFDTLPLKVFALCG